MPRYATHVMRTAQTVAAQAAPLKRRRLINWETANRDGTLLPPTRILPPRGCVMIVARTLFRPDSGHGQTEGKKTYQNYRSLYRPMFSYRYAKLLPFARADEHASSEHRLS